MSQKNVETFQKYSVLPTICILGRPNVGKSSLFNCLVGRRQAVVVEQAGTTRDRLETIIHIDEIPVKIVDTGGYVSNDKDEIYLEVKAQILQVMEEAALILFVTDTISGISPFDKEIAALLRRFEKYVIVVANKTDNEKLKNDALEFYSLGFGEPEAISCLHRRGMDSLKRRMLQAIKTGAEGKGQRAESIEQRAQGTGHRAQSTEHRAKSIEHRQEMPAEGCLRIAVVGRPNVGKSSFVNSLLGRKRVIVSDIPGTTRDSIDTYFNYEGDEYVLIDTAGIRHKRKIKATVDVYSIMRAEESIKRSDVVILLLDAKDGVTKDDLGILDFIEENGKAALLVVNKWDLAEGAPRLSMEDYKRGLLQTSNRMSKFPISFVSAKTGKKVLDTLSIVKVLDSNLNLKVSTPFLNSLFKKNDPSNLPIPRRKQRPNFLYVVQTSLRPIEFRFFVNDPARVLPQHLSFIENQLRLNLPLLGIPIKIVVCKSRKDMVRRRS